MAFSCAFTWFSETRDSHKMISISACYTSGRGARHFLGSDAAVTIRKEPGWKRTVVFVSSFCRLVSVWAAIAVIEVHDGCCFYICHDFN